MRGPELAAMIESRVKEAGVTQGEVLRMMGERPGYMCDLRGRKGPVDDDKALVAQLALDLVCAPAEAKKPGLPPPPPHLKIFCAQCDRRVFIAEGNACEAPFCKGKFDA